MADPRANEPRYPCKVCGRQFFKDSLDKHQSICAKTAKTSSKRKVFDSAKQRAGEGSDLTYRQIKQAQKKPVAPPKTNWRAKHEDFINTVRAARGVDRAIAAGGPLPPPPPPSINPDYIQCPYCARRFSQQAAERHINFCKEQSQRVNNRPPPNAAAKAKQATRTQYQAPKPKVKATPGAAVTPSSSGSRVGAGAAARPGVGAAGAAPRGRATGSYQLVQ
ncbi:hypothetical protein BaRGS_00032853, partial [Batillaria attramentaria]